MAILQPFLAYQSTSLERASAVREHRRQSRKNSGGGGASSSTNTHQNGLAATPALLPTLVPLAASSLLIWVFLLSVMLPAFLTATTVAWARQGRRRAARDVREVVLVVQSRYIGGSDGSGPPELQRVARPMAQVLGVVATVLDAAHPAAAVAALRNAAVTAGLPVDGAVRGAVALARAAAVATSGVDGVRGTAAGWVHGAAAAAAAASGSPVLAPLRGLLGPALAAILAAASSSSTATSSRSPFFQGSSNMEDAGDRIAEEIDSAPSSPASRSSRASGGGGGRSPTVGRGSVGSGTPSSSSSTGRKKKHHRSSRRSDASTAATPSR
ncbi:hypothetical protein BC828DRAFT_393635 [Blastocladiella britannica]|nr:hypothetical protein BC828DRAFT_393635 [Blastocladiella britannica]